MQSYCLQTIHPKHTISNLVRFEREVALNARISLPKYILVDFLESDFFMNAIKSAMDRFSKFDSILSNDWQRILFL